ncbi:MAG: DUF6311 domain-containing protein [Bdellovibrionales bacterium]
MKIFSKLPFYAFILLVSFILCAFTYGAAVLNPQYVEWLYKHDGMNHYLGWLFFRQEPWGFPLGQIHNFIHPIGTTVIQMDSIPVMAFFFKTFHPWLPVRFQYFGLWHFLIWALQGYAGLKIAEHLQATTVQKFLIIFLFMWSSIIFFRTDHHSLTAQFCLVISIYYYMETQKGRGPLFGSMLLTLAFISLAHPYLVAMTLPLYFATYLRAFLDHPQKKWKYIFEFTGFLTIVGFCFWQIGIFGVKDPGDLGFGSLSSDLLTYFNSLYTSSILPRLRTGWGQYEGYAYLGLGMIVLFFIQIGWLLSRKEHLKKIFKRAWPFVIIQLLIWIFSLSNIITFGGNPILNLDFIYSHLGSIPGTFRSSGRFSWPLFYFIYFVLIWSVLRRWSTQKATAILFAVALLQVIDIARYYGTSSAGEAAPAPAFRPAAWQTKASGATAMIILPPALIKGAFDCGRGGFTPDEVRHLGILAGEMGWSVNSGYSSRGDARVFQICEETWESLPQRFASSNQFFVVHRAFIDSFLQTAAKFNKSSKKKITCQHIDGFEVCR